MQTFKLDGVEFVVLPIDFDDVNVTSCGVRSRPRTAWLIGRPGCDSWVVNHIAAQGRPASAKVLARMGAERLVIEIELVGRARHEIEAAPVAIADLQAATTQLMRGSVWKGLQHALSRGDVHLASMADVLLDNATQRRHTMLVH